MTQQRDLKRRIRERQARTQESYVTARARVLAQRDEVGDLIDVVEPRDVTETAALLGLRCRVLMFPQLLARMSPRPVLERVRDALLVADAERLFALAFHAASLPAGRRWRLDRPNMLAWVERVRAGLGGISPSGENLAIHIDGVPVICSAWPHTSRPPALVVSILGELAWSAI